MPSMLYFANMFLLLGFLPFVYYKVVKLSTLVTAFCFAETAWPSDIKVQELYRRLRLVRFKIKPVGLAMEQDMILCIRNALNFYP